MVYWEVSLKRYDTDLPIPLVDAKSKEAAAAVITAVIAAEDGKVCQIILTRRQELGPMG